MIPVEICHFTKAEIAIENILSEKRLRIGQLKFTNDPRESRPKEPILFHRNDLPINSDPEGNKLKSELYSEYQRVQLNEWKVLCVTLHKPKKKLDNHDADIYNSNIRLGYSNPALWAHYADNHKGVCLIFSGKILHNNIQSKLGSKCKIFNDKVRYSANRDLVGTPMLSVKSMDIDVQETVRTHFYTYWRELFFHKHPNWNYENEYRWLLHSIEDNHLYVSIQDAIKAIIVGVDFLIKLEPKIKSLCKELNIPAGKMDWFNGIAYPKLYGIYNP